ncbi:CMRF35-like molecule 6 isoform X1 [Manis javanica]|uniref:CMRF35-like molecule 6 isoform X1 n=2 Tax=Manis javanica TaxID=9974 RepID=UPI003C6D21A0
MRSSTRTERGWTRKQRGQEGRSGTRRSDLLQREGDLALCRHLGPGLAAGDICAGEMTPRDGPVWLPPALLFLHVPGCWSLSGPESVMGTVGGSLSVQCQYGENFTENNKYWCRKSCLSPWKIVETTGSERAGRSSRVSIRDHPADLTFTVTMESLTEGDAGTYWCGIDTPWLDGFMQDPTFQVVVSVMPALTTAPSPMRTTGSLGHSTFQPAPTWSTVTWQEAPDPSQHPGSLLSSFHSLLLVFLKLPLLLSMLSAVLWVNRPQRGSRGRQSPLGVESR